MGGVDDNHSPCCLNQADFFLYLYREVFGFALFSGFLLHVDQQSKLSVCNKLN